MTAKTNTHQSADPVYEAAADGFEAGYDKAAPLPAWLGRRHRRIDRLDRQLQRFVDREKARRPRRWFFAFEIAELATSEAGSIESKREKQRLVYAELARAIAEGRFERNGHVHWLGFHGGRMTRRRLVTLAQSYSPDAVDAQMLESPEFLNDVVAQLVFPVAAVRGWRRDRGRLDSLPVEFGVGAPTEATPAPRTASVDHIRNALRVVYDEAETSGEPPPNVKQVRPLAKTLLEQQGLIASENHIGDIADEDEFKRRRRPPGKTLKSEGRTAPE